jgi:hypothetical protein
VSVRGSSHISNRFRRSKHLFGVAAQGNGAAQGRLDAWRSVGLPLKSRRVIRPPRLKALNGAIAVKKAEALQPLDEKDRFTLAMAYVSLEAPNLGSARGGEAGRRQSSKSALSLLGGSAGL